jgi:hypothetical protein
LIEGEPFHQFHGEVGPAVASDADIEKAGHVGVRETGEDLAFAAEAADEGIVGEAGPQDLEGDHHAELLVFADGTIDDAHAAFADLGENAIGADAGFDLREFGRCFEEIRFLAGVFKETLDFGAEFGIVAAEVGQQPCFLRIFVLRTCLTCCQRVGVTAFSEP